MSPRKIAGLAVVAFAALWIGCAWHPLPWAARSAPAGQPHASPRPLLHVGSSGDYAPFSIARADGTLDGFDLAVARAFAEQTGRRLVVRWFAWPALVDDLVAGAFQVAMSGVTVRPERAVRGRFSVPVADSGALVLAAASAARGGLDGLDRPDVRIAVNRGGHLERAARARFRAAEMVTLPENDAVRRALRDGRVDAAVTDTLEAPHWQATLPGTVRLGPFTRDRKAYLWRTDAEADARALDAWLLAREADGTLGAWRERYFGTAPEATATPAGALVAAVGERLSLMPSVAAHKRARGLAVRDRAREQRVLEAAEAAVAREAAHLGRPPPPREAVAAFYRAQIEAAVALQQRTLAAASAPTLGFDLDDELRPALIRIGDRIAWLLVRLERPPAASAVAAELARFGLADRHAAALSEALSALTPGFKRARGHAPGAPR